MLFLLFAEARALVPLWHPIYRESYSLEGLRDAAEQPPPAPGLWDALRAIARLAHAGCRAGDLQVTPFNGRLFAPARTPLAERRDLDDERGAAGGGRAVDAAGARSRGRERIAYRDLGVEQLGAVYETLLDYEPRVERGIGLARSRLRRPQGDRDVLHAAADRRLPRAPHARPAGARRRRRIASCSCASSIRRWAAARFSSPPAGFSRPRTNRRSFVTGGCHPSDIGEAERAAIRRTIAERCLYGVDLNPMAVQLARLSLWLATLAADRPLSFLDHRLQVGDSLLGTWLAHLRQPPPLRRRRASAADRCRCSTTTPSPARCATALPVRFSLEAMPNDTVEQVRAKERAFAALTGRDAALSRWKRIAHLWCAPWFAPAGDRGARVGVRLAVRRGADRPRARCRRARRTAISSRPRPLAEARRLFHWELEFPEVFFDRDGAPPAATPASTR